nr:hypothetical protein [Tanacetum cinerariifolium]
MGLKADKAGWGSNKFDYTENCSRLEGYSWGQKVVSGIEPEKGRAQLPGIKRWSVGMTLREVQRIWKMNPKRFRDQ